MPDTTTAWTAILLASALTLATRLGGPAIMTLLPMSPRLDRVLQNLSLAVLAALVATILARGGLREDAAALVAGAFMAAFRKSIWAMGAGMALAALWTRMAG